VQLIIQDFNLFKIMIKFKQFIVESNFNKLPSYIVDQLRKIVADYIDRGCKTIKYKPVTHLSLLGYVTISHLNETQYKIPITFTKILDKGGHMTEIYKYVNNKIVSSLVIEISLNEFKQIENKNQEIGLFRILVHETSHVVDEILKRFGPKSQESYDKIRVRMDQINKGDTSINADEIESLYRDYLMHPIEKSSISSEIHHAIMEHYSRIKTRPARQLFLKQLEVFITSNFNTYFGKDAELELPPFLQHSKYLRGFFKRLEPGSKLYKKIKISLLNLYHNLLVHYNLNLR